jgi:hypothetical protein
MSAMKTWQCVISAIILAVSLYAQDFQPLPAPPDVIGVPFYLDRSASELKKLASEPYKEHTGAAVFNSTVTTSVQLQGTASAFRIPAQEKIVIVFDATTMPRLYKFTVNGKKREFPFTKGNQRNSTPIDPLSISVSKYKGGAAYQFSADEPLTPGEYAILFAGRLYTFGIDEKK